MGLYAYITDNDRINWRKVDDPGLKEIFEEALKHDETLMISSNEYYQNNGFWRKKTLVIHYSVYHECFVNCKPVFQAKQQISASGSKQIVLAYLYGIINGSLSKSNSLK